jgi:hypothetical protein
MRKLYEEPLKFVLTTQYWTDQMKEIETGGAYTMYKGDEKFVQHSNRKT